MKKTLIFIGLVLFVANSLCFASDENVSGSTREDGAYVDSSDWSSPDNTSSPGDTLGNDSDYKDNSSLYTGEQGQNYYRNNPAPSTDVEPNNQYNQPQNNPNRHADPQLTNQINNQPRSSTGEKQTIYANGQAYKVTTQPDGSSIAKDSSGRTYRIEGDK